MRRLLVMVLLLMGGMQVLQASEYRISADENGAHTCCPGGGAHASCCPDACSTPAATASPPAITLWCGRVERVATLGDAAFVSRGESPLTRPPIL